MKFAKALAPALLASAVLGGQGSARAYCRTTTQEALVSNCPEPCITEGKPLYWAVSSPKYIFNEEGFDDVEDTLLHAALQRSFQRWNDIQCDVQGRTFPLGLNIQATPGTTTLEVGPKADEPNPNVIVYFSGEKWLEDPTLNPTAYALTAIWFNRLNGEILGADMHFNGAMGKLGVCSDEGCPDGYVDLENVATHEAGHFIGLAHSSIEGSTMWCSADRPEIEKRTLSQDDIAGACTIYPPGRSFVKDPSGEVKTCSLSRGEYAGSWPLWFAALGFALHRRRRKR
jgi:MYXO-CTERM domain-containing protein